MYSEFENYVLAVSSSPLDTPTCITPKVAKTKRVISYRTSAITAAQTTSPHTSPNVRHSRHAETKALGKDH